MSLSHMSSLSTAASAAARPSVLPPVKEHYSMTSIGLTAENTIRDNGTYFYCRRAIEGMEGVTSQHYLPMGEIGKHDFYLYVDDGRDDIQWLPPHPCAYYAIDTHLGYAYRAWKARHFDRVFVAQREAVAQFQREGIKHVEWLPLACSPEHHPSRVELILRGVEPDSIVPRYDIAFCGFLNDAQGDGFNNRLDYLDALFKTFRNSWLTTGVFHEEMAVRYLRAKIGFNVSIRNDLNMRVFEVMSTGTPLLTNRNVEGIDEFFTEGIHFVGYEGTEELLTSAMKALTEPEATDLIGANALALVRSEHTYTHRMQRIIDAMNEAA